MGDNQAIALHLAQRAIDGGRVWRANAQSGLRQPIQEIIAVRRTLEEEQQETGLQEILGLPSIALTRGCIALAEH